QDIESALEAFSASVLEAFNANAKTIMVSARSNRWWNAECKAAVDAYRNDRTRYNLREFKRTVRRVKAEFFKRQVDDRIAKNRVWDLINWVKPRRLPAVEAISYQGTPCSSSEQLWTALDSTFHAASNREADPSILDEAVSLTTREWTPFSMTELRTAIKGTSSSSSPGPDHVGWGDIKAATSDPEAAAALLKVANACIDAGHWPSHFKDSVSVVIPKPGKPSYDTPKSFRPIVLLNTVGKLVEKMLAARLQFEGLKYGAIESQQFGGITQRSTEDAGSYLVHLVRSGWASNLQTSVLAFDLANFFPSLNHEILAKVLQISGYSPTITNFFRSYLVGRRTKFSWEGEVSPSFAAEAGVGQGSALSPILAVLYLAPMMEIVKARVSKVIADILSYVDDGTLVAQSKDWATNNVNLREAYLTLSEVATKMGLVIEDSKTELFHFSRSGYGDNPPLDLGVTPFTGATPLAPKPVWRYLGIYFDRRLDFRTHAKLMCTKALTTVRAMGVLGNSSKGLPPNEKRRLYRACCLPIALYGCRLDRKS